MLIFQVALNLKDGILYLKRDIYQQGR